MSGERKAVCIIAWPAGHSRSPLIHNYWIERHKLNAEYRREAVPPEKFVEFVMHLRDHGYIGGNVTVPHKQTALGVSEPDERARAVGAANCLWYDGDRLRSTNTDVEGFLASLDAATPEWDRGLESAMVLGAGGGARAVVFALIQRSVERIYVINRTIEHAQALQKQFGAVIRVAGWDEITGLLGGTGLLVNTTTLGMVGQPPLEINLRCPASLVVADLVYAPLETALLKLARERGLRTADGLGMLLHQAVRGFELWFGVRPEVTADLRALVEADLRETVAAATPTPGAQVKVKSPGQGEAKPKRTRRNKKPGEGFSA
ncbi:MAG: shikimate dehydrogenase [Deltaproteobacteria bacterium]|nr:shikimate dehydrogenase [Deltaproteobacteria bacterium]